MFGILQHIRRKDLIAGLMVAVFTFFIALLINLGSELLIRMINNVYIALIMLLIVIFLGIFFDTIGTAATAADLSPFNARASKKVFGANQAVRIISNASVVANYCNDVIGDIAGTLSGAIGVSVVFKLMEIMPFDSVVLTGALMTSLIAALTVGGKSIGKELAIAKANEIIFSVAVFIAWFENITKIELFKKRR